MKKLKLLIFIFCLAVSAPFIYFSLQANKNLEKEERAELQYFADKLFDEMEEELTSLIVKEEGRAIDAYNFNNTSFHSRENTPYILGYLQNNPDGSFQTPAARINNSGSFSRFRLMAQLEKINHEFNKKRSFLDSPKGTGSSQILVKSDKAKSPFEEKYLRRSSERKRRVSPQQKRIEYITLGQLMSIVQPDQKELLEMKLMAEKGMPDISIFNDYITRKLSELDRLRRQTYASMYERDISNNSWFDLPGDDEKMQVEVDPMRSVFVDDKHVFIFRRIILNNQIYRQGVVVKVNEFLSRMVETYFKGQPMADFTSLTLSVRDGGKNISTLQAGEVSSAAGFVLNRSFPRPFSFLTAKISCSEIPGSPGRTTLNIMIFGFIAIILMGMFAIYKSTQAVVDLSERRSGFVSAVTHELKTPLSNIRMYIEMLEQGIASTPEREQEYYRILGSESSRLSRLINNVLEFSKLEKKQRPLNLQPGNLEEVLKEFTDILSEKLKLEGFHLKIEKGELKPFNYDREAMIQILINLVENSIKFGKTSDEKEITLSIKNEKKYVQISISDTGPGIPGSALKKVFDDFYRVDSSLTRKTGGTGIGLALVKNFVAEMGGSVSAANNKGPGCTITLLIPAG